jgi:DNA-binding NarL/FixJ family response regulator
MTAYVRPIERFGYESAVAFVRTKLGEKSFAAAWAEGRAMTLADICAALATAIPKPTSAEAVKMETCSGVVPESGRRRASSPVSLDKLTLREEEVMRLVMLGLTDAQIADKLVVSTRTVNAHLRSIYSKFGVTSRCAAIHHVTENRLL